MTKTLSETIETIHAHASTKKAKEYRIVREFPVGKAVRQGDVYILRLPDNAKLTNATKNRQLAPGTTKGSRHIVEGEVKLFQGWTPPADLFASTAKALSVSRERLLEMLAGPAIEANGAFRVTHPEHADFTLPKGRYGTWGQLDPKTMQRVQD
jgi:hypothetical protein